MNLICFECRKKYIPTLANVKIIGPDLETTCPFCGNVYSGKLNKFAGLQVGPHKPLSAEYAISMISLAEYVELNTSEYYKEKGMRHGKKKVRDI